MRNHVGAILWKQCIDTLKNKTILIQFLMFPFMTVIMENAVEVPGMQEHFFANLFAIMYVGMAPLTSMGAIIAEEKEKNTLRVMQMCNVGALEYLLGNAVYILAMCMIGSLVIGFAGGYQGTKLVIFMLIMLLGHCISVLLGAAIGVLSKNQMAATSVTVPVMMVLAFLPMLSMFNETIGKVAKYVFSGQLHLMVNSIENMQLSPENILIVSGNVVLVLAVFLMAYKKAFTDR